MRRAFANLRGKTGTTEDHGNETIFEVGEVEALSVSMLAEEHVPQTELLRLLLEVINYGRIEVPSILGL
jgi:hypothetical protein